MDECIDFRPSRTHWKDSFPLGLLFLWVVGEVNHHFTSLVDGVFPGFGSINLCYWNAATILVANPNISERECLLTVFRLSIGLRRDCRSGLRISACLRTGTLARHPILLACRRDFVLLACAFLHPLSRGRAARPDFIPSHRRGHRASPRCR